MSSLSRRRFLRGAGAAIALPFLESMPFSVLSAASAAPVGARRLVCMGVALGMHPGSWIPRKVGPNYELPRLLKPVEAYRNDFSIISGTDHPGVSGGHKGAPAFLSGVYKPERVGQSIIIRNSITFDQMVANAIGGFTRFESLQFSASPNSSNDSQLSWDEKGVSLQPEGRPERIFKQLFVNSKNPGEKRKALNQSSSVLDLVMEDAKALQRVVSNQDVSRLDDYLGAIRDVEKRIQKQREWANKPKPEVKSIGLRSTTYHQNLDLILELTALALQTDSCRVFSVDLPGGGLPIVTGNIRTSNYHGKSHHGKDPDVVEKLVRIEIQHMKSVAKFFERLKSTPEGDGNLLDHTSILFGSGLGNGSSHSNRNLPVMIAGGGMRHGKHTALTKETPLCNLFVSMMQRSGLEMERFSDSTGNLNELFG